jgi:putative thiamine transport system ATP-binding protein
MTLKLDNLAIFNQHSSDETPLLNVNVEISAGEVVSIMGPSGSGKSSLLNAIAGQLHPPFRHTGRIYLNGASIDNLPPYKRKIGVLYQDPLLFEHMSVGENIAFAMVQNKAIAASQRQTRIAAMLDSVGLTNMATRAVQSLSGGQQARVALLRTLAASPSAVLLDEPFSKLDVATRGQMRKWVFDQLTQRRLPTLMVTHDKQDAIAAGGRIIELPSC